MKPQFAVCSYRQQTADPAESHQTADDAAMCA